MRRRLWVPCLFLAALGLAMPAVASDVAREQVIKVTATEFTPASITIRKGDVVRWELQENAGSHIIMSGEVDDENPGEIFKITLTRDHLEGVWTADKTGTFPYFAQESPETMHGVITVTAATPIDATTWGRLKNLFETR